MGDEPPRTGERPASVGDAFAAEHAAFRREREESLTAADGWLAQVALVWLDDGVAELDIGSFHATATGARFVPRGDLALPETLLEIGAREWLEHGRRRYQLVRRGGARGIRVRDADAPARSLFRGLGWYPVDPRWVRTARLGPAEGDGRDVMHYTGGQAEAVTLPGELAFDAPDGQPLALQPFAQPDGTLLVVFRDATSGQETYPLCRYFTTPAPGPDGSVRLDFNRAAAPACAFVPTVTCVLPPPENALPVAVRAGELWYRG